MVQREPRQQQVVDAGAPTAKALERPQLVVDLTETSEPQLDVDLRSDPERAALDLHVARSYERFVKPGIDRILAIVLYSLLVPLLLALILAIWGTMGRPAIFRQQRVGKDGQPFTMYKLRTMRTDRRVEQIPFDGPDRRRVHKTPGDPRITGTGWFLRKWSLDEIPQLINVGALDT